MLVLYVVGIRSKRGDLLHRRLSEYDYYDFEILFRFINSFIKIVTTSHALAETTNLLQQGRDHRYKAVDLDRLRLLCQESMLEVHTPLNSLPEQYQPVYQTLGLTDAALLVALEECDSMITADLSLHRAAQTFFSNKNSVNFNHLRYM